MSDIIYEKSVSENLSSDLEKACKDIFEEIEEMIRLKTRSIQEKYHFDQNRVFLNPNNSFEYSLDGTLEKMLAAELGFGSFNCELPNKYRDINI